MKQDITFSDFTARFHRMGRGDQFSYKALRLLYDFLEEIQPDYELDVIALCCEFIEDDIETTLKGYDLRSKKELEDNTLVIGYPTDDTVIYQNF